MATELNKLTTLEQLKSSLTAAKQYTDTQDTILSERIDAVTEKIVPADWSQNDSSATDYIKNRTHWEERTETEILPETTVTLENGSANLPDVVLVSGDTYAVNWNGAEWTCVAGDLDGQLWLGNIYRMSGGAVGSQDTGEPFCMVIPVDGSGLWVATGDPLNEVTLSIMHIRDNIHHLDPKYIKDMYVDNTVEVVSGTITNPNLDSSGFSQIDAFNCDESLMTYLNNLTASRELTSAVVTINGVTKSFVTNGDNMRVVEVDYTSTYAVRIEKGLEIYDNGVELLVIRLVSDGGYVLTINPQTLNDLFGISDPTEVETISCAFYSGDIKQLDEKFIPDTIARAEQTNAAVEELSGRIDALESSVATDEEFSSVLDEVFGTNA